MGETAWSIATPNWQSANEDSHTTATASISARMLIARAHDPIAPLCEKATAVTSEFFGYKRACRLGRHGI